MTAAPHQTFILSPADCGGPRARRLLERLRSGATEALPLGAAFSEISALYFRGKLGYAERFARPRAGQVPVRVITPTHGLLPADVPLRSGLLEAFADGKIDEKDEAYRGALAASLRRMGQDLQADDRIVFLGSLATRKYGAALETLGAAVAVPRAFVGLGNMQRGSLLLRRAESGEELAYVPLEDVFAARPRSR